MAAATNEHDSVANARELGISRLADAPPGACSLTIKAFPAEAWADSGSLVAVWSASAAAALRVFARFAASVAGASVLPAASSRHLHSVALAADGPVLASAEVSGGLGFAARKVCLAAAGTSGPF